MERIRVEWSRLRRGVATMDRQALVVLIVAATVGQWKYTFGSLKLFRHTIAPALGLPSKGLVAFGWLFGGQFLLGFALAAGLLLLAFRRRPRDVGLGLGDWRFAGTILALYLPVMLVGTWVLSDLSSFQHKYPLYRGASADWGVFFAFEGLFLLYWLGWEYLWRGFVLFGTAPALGRWSIVVQMLPFAALHATKPIPEAYLSIVGGLALGVVVWRARSFWIAVPLHAGQMMALDLWVTLRARTGAEGVGLHALTRALHDIL